VGHYDYTYKDFTYNIKNATFVINDFTYNWFYFQMSLLISVKKTWKFNSWKEEELSTISKVVKSVWDTKTILIKTLLNLMNVILLIMDFTYNWFYFLMSLLKRVNIKLASLMAGKKKSCLQ